VNLKTTFVVTFYYFKFLLISLEAEMDINHYQKWISEFYKSRDWYQYNSFIRSNFLMEEVGEVAQAIRTIEIGRDRPDETTQDMTTQLAHLTEELGDVLDNVFILADKYDISLEEIMQSHKTKLIERYQLDN
jgi:NTP pyrophosphatase (non-canonical NTP hydrolase)